MLMMAKMMPGFGASGPSGPAALLPQDVFATSLYTGNGASRTITNGLNLSGEGGLVWIKARSAAYSHRLTDTARGATNALLSNGTGASFTESGVTAFGTSGFNLGSEAGQNEASTTYAAWSARRAPKFFDVVEWTGNQSGDRVLSHSLGTAPGMVILKKISDTGDWSVSHRSATNNLVLNRTASQSGDKPVSSLTSTDFTVTSFWNTDGETYVAYLFAHDTAADGVVQCGSYTTDGAGVASVTLGWQPQFIMSRRVDGIGSWDMNDSARGLPATASGISPNLRANASDAESTTSKGLGVNPTGFTVGFTSASAIFAYLAIRAPI